MIIEGPPERPVDLYGGGTVPLATLQPGQFCLAWDGRWCEFLGGYLQQRECERVYIAHVRRETLSDEQARQAGEGIIRAVEPREMPVDVFGRGVIPLEQIAPGECFRTTDGRWREFLGGYRQRVAGGKLGERLALRVRQETYTTEQLIRMTTPRRPTAFVAPVAPNVGWKRVTEVYKSDPAPLLRVYYGDTMVKSTHNHPWYVQGKGWIATRDLSPGDMLQTESGQGTPVLKVEDHGEIEPVYNLQVEDYHTYFVGGKEDSPFVLVHNSSPQAAETTRRLEVEVDKDDKVLLHLRRSDGSGVTMHVGDITSRTSFWGMEFSRTATPRDGYSTRMPLEHDLTFISWALKAYYGYENHDDMSDEEMVAVVLDYLQKGGYYGIQKEFAKAKRAMDRLGYIGPAPGTAEYTAMVNRQRMAEIKEIWENNDTFHAIGILVFVPGGVNPNPFNFDFAATVASAKAPKAIPRQLGGTGGAGVRVMASKGKPKSHDLGTGKYSEVGGHHVHAKAALKDSVQYSKSKGFSISQKYMKGRDWDHQAMTNKQRELFNELAKSGDANTLKEHTRIAVKALEAGGATRAEARELVAESLRNLRDQGVREPTNIPWN